MTPHGSPLALDVVVPVYNEQFALDASIRRLAAYLSDEMSTTWQITIADNASTDGTPQIADRLADEIDGVRVIHTGRKGRGHALKLAWGASNAEVLAYVDVDLSTDLAALPPLVAPLLSGHSDVAIGTRLSRSSRVVRGGKREFISRSYNVLLHGALGVSFSDAQCGFKAIRSDVAARLLPLVQDDAWFFDTELLVIAQRSGLRIHEVPVDWIDDTDSRVEIMPTIREDLRGVYRVGRDLARGAIPVQSIYAELGRTPIGPAARPSFLGQVLRFGIVGALSTAAYAVLYLLLQGVLGAQAANFSALLITAVANTWANRRFTFAIRGPAKAATHQFQGLIVFGLAWGITSGSLVALDALAPNAGTVAELVVLTVANLVATVLRFVLLRRWVFRTPKPVEIDISHLSLTSGQEPALSTVSVGAVSQGQSAAETLSATPTADQNSSQKASAA
ncbi:bifunctional glycosyltransferase family 2/GtrA family protein [Subtercola frigoramans]|uniref:dolichyl-phosphate beta-glucosyltransferase n=1 Tax=Subtercola frigoramans TaxID=120298 RepID=A0ABS2L093_9MICO|nr:bifunctional glycosyltransferase family 2/GtrA family protein [Subtercola frigoramans]MBM7470501.1 glycosyltransferase involved in cell wall biosynthesis [Subtercola frigoramans]